MTSKIWTKKVTQQFIKTLRDAGLTVDKIDSGYQCKLNEEVIFKAMIGHAGYLVRYEEQVITETIKKAYF
jgi:hypothetical protein